MKQYTMTCADSYFDVFEEITQMSNAEELDRLLGKLVMSDRYDEIANKILSGEYDQDDWGDFITHMRMFIESNEEAPPLFLAAYVVIDRIEGYLLSGQDPQKLVSMLKLQRRKQRVSSDQKDCMFAAGVEVYRKYDYEPGDAYEEVAEIVGSTKSNIAKIYALYSDDSFVKSAPDHFNLVTVTEFLRKWADQPE